jgi:hypothetical protein
MTFRVVRDPSDEALAQLQSANPTNPFASAAYVAARRALGAAIVLFTADLSASAAPTGAIAYMHGHAISRSLEITSAPPLANAAEFWDGVRAFCSKNHVADVTIDSYCADSVALPPWSAPSQLRDRTEWVLQLTPSSSPSFGSNHRRNINKARKQGVAVTHTDDPAAAQVHSHLMASSMQRRSLRGEDVPSAANNDAPYERAFLVSGAARIFQASYSGDVVSSLLVLNAPSGAYYQSAGTTPEGMEIGASTFLVSEIIRTLAEEGRTAFNLGGAGNESEGLRRFKSGFGAQPVTLAAGTYQLASPIHRKIRTAMRLLREPRELGRSLSRRLATSL